MNGYYKIDYDHQNSYQQANLDIDGYAEAIVGTWIGYATTPWTPPYSVEISFNSDGTYSSRSLGNGRYGGPALYYGLDEDSPKKTYDLNRAFTSGKVGGLITIVHSFTNTDLGDLVNLSLNSTLDVLEFEFLHRGQYGPLKYKLTRKD